MRNITIFLISLACLQVLILVAGISSASTVIFEAGPFIIILNETMEKSELGSLDILPVVWFDPAGTLHTMPVKSREKLDDLLEANYYEFHISSLIGNVDDMGAVGHPTTIMISDKPVEGVGKFAFTPRAVKEVTVGRLQPINTTLYTGEWVKQTPYFVNFTVNGIYCCVYNQNTGERTITDMLKGLDIIRKGDLRQYNLSKLWSEG